MRKSFQSKGYMNKEASFLSIDNINCNFSSGIQMTLVDSGFSPKNSCSYIKDRKYFGNSLIFKSNSIIYSILCSSSIGLSAKSSSRVICNK